MKQLLIAIGLLLVASCSGSKDLRSSEWSDPETTQLTPTEGAAYNEDGERILAPALIPPAISEAAMSAVPGLVIELAEEEGNGVYCVHGTADGHFYEVEMSSTGEVLEIEMDDEEDGDDEDDDGDDDDDDEGDEGDEVEIPLSEVPESVKQAAIAAVPGIVLEEAEKETENGVLVYCLEGEVGDKEYEIEVSAAGEVLEVEEDDEDDDEDDDD